MSIQRFTDIIAWQKARGLVSAVHRHCLRLPLARDFTVKDQIRRAALSVMSNIAEGFGRRGDTEFSRFLDIARASAIEVQSLTFACEDLEYLTPADAQALREQAEEVLRLIGGLQRNLSPKRVRESDVEAYHP